MIEKDDWRLLTPSIDKLRHKNFIYNQFKIKKDKWDHEHCEFCNAKFSENRGDLNFGYSTEDEYYWVCEKCFQDFQDLLDFKLLT